MEIEDRFEANWPHWVENSAEWTSFLCKLEDSKNDDLLEEARRLELATEEVIEQERGNCGGRQKIARTDPWGARTSNRVLTLLAWVFPGEPGSPAIPYARLGG